jgi:hypothetical protein
LARGFGGTESEFSADLTVDDLGNSYLVGSFRGTADFDPGPGVFILTSAGQADSFVVRLDAVGRLVWARSFGGTNSDLTTGVAVDAARNVYVVGSFFGTVDFDPGAGSFPLTSAGVRDGYIVKLDAVGNLVWARQLAGIDSLGIESIAVDRGGNVCVVGHFQGTADLDPGPGFAPRTSAGDDDAFVVKLDTDGTFASAGSIGGSAQDVAAAVDDAGAAYVAGRFQFTADFDPGPGEVSLTSTGAGDNFMAKIDAGGTLDWARSFGNGDVTVDVTVDRAGNAYAAGSYSAAEDFDPGPGVAVLTDSGAYLVKFDTDGNFGWAGSFGSRGSFVSGLGVAADRAGRSTWPASSRGRPTSIPARPAGT